MKVVWESKHLKSEQKRDGQKGGVEQPVIKNVTDLCNIFRRCDRLLFMTTRADPQLDGVGHFQAVSMNVKNEGSW